MEISKCPNCGTIVKPTSSGECPACRKAFFLPSNIEQGKKEERPRAESQSWYIPPDLIVQRKTFVPEEAIKKEIEEAINREIEKNIKEIHADRRTREQQKQLKERRNILRILTVILGIVPFMGWDQWILIKEWPIIAFLSFWGSVVTAYLWQKVSKQINIDSNIHYRPVPTLYVETLILFIALNFFLLPFNNGQITIMDNLLPDFWYWNFWSKLCLVLGFSFSLAGLIFFTALILAEVSITCGELAEKMINAGNKYLDELFKSPFKQRSSGGKTLEIVIILLGVSLALGILIKFV